MTYNYWLIGAGLASDHIWYSINNSSFGHRLRPRNTSTHSATSTGWSPGHSSPFFLGQI
ncbi:hypothetical protein B0J17DRAFT_682313 [Rhizoctonia solani]|nr:hypothetical protein B0J17DRAFT_682313 [Rhizoctonia solani]